MRLSLGYAAARFRQGAMRDCVEWCEEVVDDARNAGALDELAHAYYLLHLAYTSLGNPARAKVRDLALPIYEELGDLLGQANVLNNLGIDAYYEGRWKEALAYYERSRNARERIGDVIGAATIANNIAEIYSDQGRLAEAEALLVDVRETCDLAGSRLLAAVAAANLGRAAARGGRPDEARELLAAALAAFREIGAGSFIFETHVRLAEAAAFAGDGEQALVAAAAAEELEETPTPSVEALLFRVRAIAHALRGESAEAEIDLDRSLEIARGCDAVYEVALSLRTRARLRGDGALAREAEGLLAGLDVVAAPEPGL
jgi:tetratricopeptide (TPR) repeat protein